MNFHLKQNMLLGSASAATQIEGGELNHCWNDWYHQGKIKDGSNPARANDHYTHWKEDADLMHEMGLQIYRMGIEWARIMPEEGKVDESVIAHYREELTYLIQLGIKPLLTIHHFTNPSWFENKGGFSNNYNIPIFLSFVKLVVTAFGDLVSEYITINEPNVYAVSSYFYGEFPPGKRSFKEAMTVMSIMGICHIKAYHLIHFLREKKGFTDTKVSFAHHLRVFEPEDKRCSWHRLSASALDYLFQDVVSHAFYTGHFPWPMRKSKSITKGIYCDFIAINYYSRSTVSGFGDGVKDDAPINDLGWEIYPDGIVTCAKEIYKMVQKPIYITENGTCDNTDSFRSRYIYEHIKALSESDLPIERYYHWCFCDNFEWLEGESARFGLVHVDYETQKRTIKTSGHFYSQIIKEKGVTEELYNKYVKGIEYNT